MRSVLNGIWLVLGAAILTTLAVSGACQGRAQRENMALLQSLNGAGIKSVVLADEGGAVLDSVSDPVDLESFARSARMVEPYRPNHPSYSGGCVLVLHLADGRNREFEVHTMRSEPIACVYFIRRMGRFTFHGGQCQSATLYDWLRRHLPDLAADGGTPG